MFFWGRNIEGGGLGGIGLPTYHGYVLPKIINIAKWTHVCYGYSSILHQVHMVQDGLEIFSFNYTDTEEGPLPSTMFTDLRIGKNFRGLITDLQVYDKFFGKLEMKSWTTGCNKENGEIFSLASEKINIKTQ